VSVALSRRLFLFGSAAALATPAIAKIIPAPVLAPFQLPAIPGRFIGDIFFEADHDAWSTIEVGVRGESHLKFAMTIPPLAVMRWSAVPLEEIVLSHADVLEVAVKPHAEGRIAAARANIIYWIGRGDSRRGFIEEFSFPSGHRQSWPLDARSAEFSA